MIEKTFEHIVEEQFNIVRDVLLFKGKEYKREFEDRLAYFKTAAELSGVSPAEALAGMMIKHTISIYSMVKNSETYCIELWNEKITDHINYLLLLKALVLEEKETKCVEFGDGRVR